MKNKLFIFLVAVYILKTDICYTQWQPDVRLTNNPANSYTSNSNAWCIAGGDSDAVHVVWYDSCDGNLEIYYKRSADGGVSWGGDTRLTNNPAISNFPSISVSASFVHIVWQDKRDGNDEIYYKRSTNSGVSWEADTRLTNSSHGSNFPSVSVSGSVVHVVWYESIYDIYYKRSTDGGVTWDADTRLTYDPYFSLHPSVSVSGQVVHVVWTESRDNNREIYCKRSTDGGVNWGADTRLTYNSANSWTASVSVSGQVVHVVWTDERDGTYEIYYKRSTDGGVSWGADTRLSNIGAASLQPSLSTSVSSVHVVWFDDRDGNFEIYYKRSTNEGISWGADTRLTNDPSISRIPSLSVSGQIVHIIWTDNRDGNWEIYYKRNPTVVGITNINSEFLKEFSLSQNYPNPFNPVTTIRFVIPSEAGIHTGNIKLSIYNSLGQFMNTLINESAGSGLSPREYEVEFNGNNLSSGLYFYSLSVDGKVIDTKKMLLVK